MQIGLKNKKQKLLVLNKGMLVKKNNKGYTLVELIVIIAILAVLVTIVSYSIGMVFRNRSREAASDFDSMLSSAKMAALSGEYYEVTAGGTTTTHNPKLEMSYDASNDEYVATLYTISDSTPAQTEDLGDGVLGISYSLDGGTTESTVDATRTIGFVYNKETGALQEFIVNDVAQASLPNTITLDFGAGYVITIYPTTGYQEFR